MTMNVGDEVMGSEINIFFGSGGLEMTGEGGSDK